MNNTHWYQYYLQTGSSQYSMVCEVAVLLSIEAESHCEAEKVARQVPGVTFNDVRWIKPAYVNMSFDPETSHGSCLEDFEDIIAAGGKLLTHHLIIPYGESGAKAIEKTKAEWEQREKERIENLINQVNEAHASVSLA